jgi:pimeloyl-ACP methyl ester carboxylesterase
MIRVLLMVSFLLTTGCGLMDDLAQRILYPVPKHDTPWNMEDLTILKVNDTVGAYDQTAEGPAILYFHGNAVDVRIMDEAGYWGLFQSMGLKVYAVEYPGYGLASGSPSEESLVAAGVELYKYLKDVEGEVQIWGRSIGSVVAAQVAARVKPSRLVLMSPFTTFKDMLKTNFLGRFVSDKFISKNTYDQYLIELPVKTLIVHGTKDEVIPFEMGAKLAVAHDAELYRAEGRGHNDLFTAEVLGKIKQHLKGN